MNAMLVTSLRRLRLSGLVQSLDVRLQEASGNGLNHVEFLELILQDELARSVCASKRTPQAF